MYLCGMTRYGRPYAIWRPCLLLLLLRPCLREGVRSDKSFSIHLINDAFRVELFHRFIRLALRPLLTGVTSLNLKRQRREQEQLDLRLPRDQGPSPGCADAARVRARGSERERVRGREGESVWGVWRDSEGGRLEREQEGARERERGSESEKVRGSNLSDTQPL
jgi:hypothetical protein